MCKTKKSKKPARKKIKGKSYPNYGPPSTSSDTRTAKEKFDSNPARKAYIRARERRKKRKARAEAEAAKTTTATTTTATEETPKTEVGSTSVTPSSIYTKDPEDAMAEQELLAQEELRRQRVKRARAKQSLLRRRLERTAEVGSGRRVLSGTERDLLVQSRQAGSGRRGGAGRRSLITGSTGGIGYYSRFL
jgi:hypothetical protein